MKIAITLDDVLRDKTMQIMKMYKKYIDNSFDIEGAEVSNIGDMWKVLGFGSQKEYNKFLYVDYPFEIFAEANCVERMLDKNLNLWLLSFKDNETIKKEPEVILANPFEFNLSIGNTCMFLAKCATRCREFVFPTDSSTLWNRCDVMVTADPRVLATKPEGKTAVRIKTSYNEMCDSEYTFDTLLSFINDNETLLALMEKYDVE